LLQFSLNFSQYFPNTPHTYNVNVLFEHNCIQSNPYISKLMGLFLTSSNYPKCKLICTSGNLNLSKSRQRQFMVGESDKNVFLIQIDASIFAEFEISEFEISRVDYKSYNPLKVNCMSNLLTADLSLHCLYHRYGGIYTCHWPTTAVYQSCALSFDTRLSKACPLL